MNCSFMAKMPSCEHSLVLSCRLVGFPQGVVSLSERRDASTRSRLKVQNQASGVQLRVDSTENSTYSLWPSCGGSLRLFIFCPEISQIPKNISVRFFAAGVEMPVNNNFLHILNTEQTAQRLSKHHHTSSEKSPGLCALRGTCTGKWWDQLHNLLQCIFINSTNICWSITSQHLTKKESISSAVFQLRRRRRRRQRGTLLIPHWGNLQFEKKKQMIPKWNNGWNWSLAPETNSQGSVFGLGLKVLRVGEGIWVFGCDDD